MKPLYIFDLDGTLALIDHRRHFVERERGKQDWDAFFLACDKDEPCSPVIRVMETLRYSGADIRVWSGRSDMAKEQTIDWLAHHTSFCTWELEPPVLLMRQEKDYTPDDEMKQQWLSELSKEDRDRLVAVFDDRDKVVAMWRKNEVPCFQVAPGEF